MRFHGGGKNRGIDIKAGWIVIDLADNYGSRVVDLFGIKCARIAQWSLPYKVISIPVRDFGIPIFPRGFWEDLLDDLAESIGTDEYHLDIIVTCDGGHGRTGTVLAILAGLTGAAATDPVAFIRENYCDQVVETQGQCNYVQEMTGIDVIVGPRQINYHYGKGGKGLGGQYSYYDPKAWDDWESGATGWENDDEGVEIGDGDDGGSLLDDSGYVPVICALCDREIDKEINHQRMGEYDLCWRCHYDITSETGVTDDDELVDQIGQLVDAQQVQKYLDCLSEDEVKEVLAWCKDEEYMEGLNDADRAVFESWMRDMEDAEVMDREEGNEEGEEGDLIILSDGSVIHHSKNNNMMV